MESRDFIYFFIGVLSMFVGMFVYPYVTKVRMHIKQYFTKKKHTPKVYCDDLQSQIDELKEQLNNVAENHYRRETNRKNNIRKTVREYLEELRNK